MQDNHVLYVGSDDLLSLEQGMMEDAFGAAPEDIGQHYGYGRRRLGRALLAYCSGLPTRPILNRLVGLKSSQPDWRRHLREAIAEFDLRRTTGIIETMAGDLLLQSELYELGLQPTSEGAFTLVRSCRPYRFDEAHLPIRDLTAEDGTQFVDLVSTVFHMPAHFVEHYSRFIGRSGWHISGAFDGGMLVAIGGLYFEQRHAYLCFGATHADCRGRGLQKSLIVKRIEEARRRDAVFMSVSVASLASGASDPSFRNLHRVGFRVASERIFFSPTSSS